MLHLGDSIMDVTKRLSVNTSLRNARIFDDEAWDEVDGTQIKKTIKKEPQDEDECHDNTLENGELQNSFLPNIKKEKNLCKTPSPEPSTFGDVKFDPQCIKTENLFDDSPYNKEIFKKLRIKEETPIKSENEDANINPKNSFKSAKRTVFTRDSPYKRCGADIDKVSMKSRLGPKINNYDVPRGSKRSGNYESDPVIISRREKQIEYGKNTIGYDNYKKSVSKESRKPEDPQTPNKYKKYSRRGWDGLIKKWRLQLHKYDPPEDS